MFKKFCFYNSHGVYCILVLLLFNSEAFKSRINALKRFSIFILPCQCVVKDRLSSWLCVQTHILAGEFRGFLPNCLHSKGVRSLHGKYVLLPNLSPAMMSTIPMAIIRFSYLFSNVVHSTRGNYLVFLPPCLDSKGVHSSSEQASLT